MPAKKITTSASPDLGFLKLEVSPSLIAQAIYVYQSNAHRGISKTQSRGVMDRSTRKIYKQKGTGNARHGARSAPIFVGGGITFGPSGMATPLKSLNQKMKLRALAGILHLYKKEDRLAVVDTSQIKNLSTKKVLKLFPQDVSGDNYGLVHAGKNSQLLKSSSNISGLTMLSAARLNAFKVAQNKKLIFTHDAVKVIKDRLAGVKTSKK